MENIDNLVSIKDTINQVLSDTDNTTINEFKTWIEPIVNEMGSDLYPIYPNFVKNFPADFRSRLFDQIYTYFLDDTIITDEIVYYFKLLVISVIEYTAKYRELFQIIRFNQDSMTSNLKLIPKKGIFLCTVDNIHHANFKDNGNIYYITS
jgi:hypothetical protein